MFDFTATGRLVCPTMEQATGLVAVMSLSDEDLGFRTNPNRRDMMHRLHRLLAELELRRRSLAGRVSPAGSASLARSRMVCFPQQVHGNAVRTIPHRVPASHGDPDAVPVGAPDEVLPPDLSICYLPDCDGLITDRSDVVIASQYADCTPIVLAAPRCGVFGVVHSGWRGTLGRIASRAVAQMERDFGVAPQDISATIWPAIGMESFEVSEDVGASFLAAFADEMPHDVRWIEQRGVKYHIDTHEVNRHVLEALGVRVADSRGYCTCADPRFHSYRRDRDRCGRMVLLVTPAALPQYTPRRSSSPHRPD